jgi:hypothetical protein
MSILSAVTGMKPSGGSPGVYHDLEAKQCSVGLSRLERENLILPENQGVDAYQQYLPMPNAVYQFGDLRSPLSPLWWYRHNKHDLWRWKVHSYEVAVSNAEIHPIDCSALRLCQTAPRDFATLL